SGARLKLRPGETLNEIPAEYNGFSFETSQLADPDYFAPGDASFIAFFRRLSADGVLRVGGNSSEFCWWKATSDAQQPQVRSPGQGRADNYMPQNFTPITPAAIDNLRGFLDATGWHCIYGLNFGTGSPERDAVEAAYVAKALGPRLLYFQIGNEPDLYKSPHNMLRPAGWDFPDYLKEWTAIADAVSARVPEARFAGPDVASASDWVVRFAQAAPARMGKRLVGLSGHYYAEGPPDSPDANIANLLKTDPRIADRMGAIMPAAHAAGLNFRMTEGNSCFRGGKPGMSNAFASSLWGGDYMLDMAARGCKGINFHGGLGKQITAGLGGKLPGARNAADVETAQLGTFYSPLAGNNQEGYDARPIFYGMLLAQQFAGTRLVANQFNSMGANATAYTASTGDGLRIAIFNKDMTQDIDIAVDLAGAKARRARAWRLAGPALDATSGVTLAGAEIVHGSAEWQPRRVEQLAVLDGRLALSVPRASAVLLFVG
ncbi:MAG TPA: hypothetical protein VIJ72_05285, partial [Rhizomicrobium sp.]